MKDQTEDLIPVADDCDAANVAEDPLGSVDLLALCETWRAMDFATPCHDDRERRKGDR